MKNSKVLSSGGLFLMIPFRDVGYAVARNFVFTSHSMIPVVATNNTSWNGSWRFEAKRKKKQSHKNVSHFMSTSSRLLFRIFTSRCEVFFVHDMLCMKFYDPITSSFSLQHKMREKAEVKFSVCLRSEYEVEREECISCVIFFFLLTSSFIIVGNSQVFYIPLSSPPMVTTTDISIVAIIYYM